MNNKTCGECKFRGKPVEKYWDDEYYDDEDEQLTVRDYFTCDRIKHVASEDRVPREADTYVVDGSGYFAALRVSTDFGCNAFKEK